jgi:hypothetical protein
MGFRPLYAGSPLRLGEARRSSGLLSQWGMLGMLLFVFGGCSWYGGSTLARGWAARSHTRARLFATSATVRSDTGWRVETTDMVAHYRILVWLTLAREYRLLRSREVPWQCGGVAN